MLDIKKTAVHYLTATLFCVLVNFIYSRFSHGVSSFYMTYMFLYPLIGGIIFIFLKKHLPYLSSSFYRCAVLTLTLGSFTKGVLQIAGTDSPYIRFYYFSGAVLFLLSLIPVFIEKFQNA